MLYCAGDSAEDLETFRSGTSSGDIGIQSGEETRPAEMLLVSLIGLMLDWTYYIVAN